MRNRCVRQNSLVWNLPCWRCAPVRNTGVDYTIMRKGSTEPPVRVHLDEIKAFETFNPTAHNDDSDYDSEDDALQPASAQTAPTATKPANKHSKCHEAQRIMAEHRLSPRQGCQVETKCSTLSSGRTQMENPSPAAGKVPRYNFLFLQLV